jgi:hypothetical protein
LRCSVAVQCTLQMSLFIQQLQVTHYYSINKMKTFKKYFKNPINKCTPMQHHWSTWTYARIETKRRRRQITTINCGKNMAYTWETWQSLNN